MNWKQIYPNSPVLSWEAAPSENDRTMIFGVEPCYIFLHKHLLQRIFPFRKVRFLHPFWRVFVGLLDARKKIWGFDHGSVGFCIMSCAIEILQLFCQQPAAVNSVLRALLLTDMFKQRLLLSWSEHHLCPQAKPNFQTTNMSLTVSLQNCCFL